MEQHSTFLTHLRAGILYIKTSTDSRSFAYMEAFHASEGVSRGGQISLLAFNLRGLLFRFEDTGQNP